MQRLRREIAELLHDKNFILNSGHALGIDTMFENHAGKRKRIFLPFKVGQPTAQEVILSKTEIVFSISFISIR